mgnify:CR=1 FL=1
MRMGFYAKLAVNGIRKNARLYVPYLLTCAGMVMMFYIVSYLQDTPVLAGIRGGEEMQAMLSLGSGVMGVFGAIFLMYTNSFLIRRRKKEFGLYNVLGMSKRISVFAAQEGFGFQGISVALIGGSDPLGVLFAGLFYGILKYGGTKLNLIGAPSEVINIITGTVVFFIAISHVFRIRVRKGGKKNG